MSYTDQAALSRDAHFRDRIAACAATQEEVTIQPTVWADQYQWALAAAPGIADAYAYAIATGVPDPGKDPAVITDEQILAAVQAQLAE